MLLSVCIPSYNRALYLKKSLENLLTQIPAYKLEVEVILNDNASSEDLQTLTQSISKEYQLPIIYSKNVNHVDAETNFVLTVSKATGDYVYLMGDDDIVSPNFFDIIIPLLRLHKYGLIHFGRLVGDENCSNNRIHDPEYTGSILDCSFANFVKRVMSAPNFMSSLIFDRRCWVLGEKYRKDNYYGYNWFAQIYYGALELSLPCLYYYFPLVLMRNPPRVWARFGVRYFIVGMSNIFCDLDEQIPGLYTLKKKRMHDTTFYDIVGSLAGVRIDRNFYRKIRHEFAPHLNKKEWCLLNSYLYLPFPAFLNRIVSIYLKISRFLKKKILSWKQTRKK